MKRIKLISTITLFSALGLSAPIITALTSCSAKEYNISFVTSGIKMPIPIEQTKVKVGEDSVVDLSNLPNGIVFDVPFVKCNGTELSKDKYEIKDKKILFTKNAIQGDIVIGLEIKQAPVIFTLDEKVDGKVVINDGQPVISKTNEELIINIKQPGLIDNDFIRATPFVDNQPLKIKQNNQTSGFDYWYDWDIINRFVNVHILPNAINKGQLKINVDLAPIYIDSEKISDKDGNRLKPATDYWVDQETDFHYYPVEALPYRWSVMFSKDTGESLKGQILCRHHGQATYSVIDQSLYEIEYVTTGESPYWVIILQSHVIDGDIQLNLIYDKD